MKVTRGWLVGKTALLAALVVLLLGNSASAQPFGPEQEAAYQEAVAYWGGSLPGCSSVTKEVLVVGAGEADELGRATTPLPGAQPVPCTIWVVSYAHGCALRDLMHHEVGHLTGRDHTDTPGDFMNPASAPFCEARDRRWYRNMTKRIARKRKVCSATRPTIRCRAELRRLREIKRDIGPPAMLYD